MSNLSHVVSSLYADDRECTSNQFQLGSIFSEEVPVFLTLVMHRATVIAATLLASC